MERVWDGKTADYTFSEKGIAIVTDGSSWLLEWRKIVHYKKSLGCLILYLDHRNGGVFLEENKLTEKEITFIKGKIIQSGA